MRSPFTRKLLAVIGMEFRLTAANRAFVVLTLLGPILIVALSVVPTLVSMRGATSERSIAVVGGPPELVAEIGAALAPSKVMVKPSAESESELDARVIGGELYGYLMIPPDVLDAQSISFVTSASADWQTAGTLQSVIGASVVAARLVRAGIEPGSVGTLLAQPRVESRRIGSEGEKKQQDFLSALLSGLSFTFLLYMTVLMYGQAIGRSVVIEKTSKTVEIMLSSVRPSELLFGKILGKGSASLLQYAIWIAMAALVLKVLGPVVKVDLPVIGGFRSMAYLVAFFLMAFFLYSSAFAALGAASEDEQHLGQLAWPLIVFLVVPMLFIGAIVQNPDGAVTVALSLFPLTAPIVMFQRLVLGNPPGWQVTLSVALILATTAGVVALSARIFRVGILMTGKRYRLGEVLRWISYR